MYWVFFLSVLSVRSLEKPAVSMAGTGQQHTSCPLQHRLLSLCPSQMLLLLLFLSADRNACCFPFNNLDAKLENVNYAEAVFYFCQNEIKMECAYSSPSSHSPWGQQWKPQTSAPNVFVLLHNCFFFPIIMIELHKHLSRLNFTLLRKVKINFFVWYLASAQVEMEVV